MSSHLRNQIITSIWSPETLNGGTSLSKTHGRKVNKLLHGHVPVERLLFLLPYTAASACCVLHLGMILEVLTRAKKYTSQKNGCHVEEMLTCFLISPLSVNVNDQHSAPGLTVCIQFMGSLRLLNKSWIIYLFTYFAVNGSFHRVPVNAFLHPTPGGLSLPNSRRCRMWCSSRIF